jgi:hypothetical protein
MSARNTFAALSLLMIVVAGARGTAQEFRGAIEGTVADSTSGVLPGVTVTVTNTATAVEQHVVTDESGRFRVVYPNPGSYSVAAELSGFKKFVRVDNQVRVGDVLRVDVVLEAGGVSETVSVTAERPPLNTSSGISGTTVDSKQIAELPLGDGTAYMLTRLAPGIMDTSDLHFARPADNGNLAGIVTNGVQGGNEFTIDGSPKHVERARRRVLAAVRCHRTVQGPDDCVRRAERSYGWRSGQPRGEERHQLAKAGQQLLQSQRRSIGDAAAHDAQQRHEADA